MSAQVALVTGGSRGIGRAIALRLAADGYRIVVNYRSRDTDAEETRRAVADAGTECTTYRADVSESGDVRTLFEHVRATYGLLDVLVNCAGRVHEALFAMTPPAAFMKVVADNLAATVFCSHAALPLMIKQRSGAIVNVSSTAANGVAGLTAYGASKAAVNALTRGLAREVAALGIRVNAVAPSWTQTEMTENITSNPKLVERIRRIPVGRIARPEEVAAVVSALVRGEMTYVIGQTIAVDGGGS